MNEPLVILMVPNVSATVQLNVPLMIPVLESVTFTIPEVASTVCPLVSGELNSIVTLLLLFGSVKEYEAIESLTVIEMTVFTVVPATSKFIPVTWVYLPNTVVTCGPIAENAESLIYALMARVVLPDLEQPENKASRAMESVITEQLLIIIALFEIGG